MKQLLSLSTLFLMGSLFTSAVQASRLDFALDRPLGPSLDHEIQRYREINQKSSRSSDRDASPGCKERYEKFYNKKVMKITLGFGYGDSTPGTMMWDFFGAYSLTKRLLQPCGPDVNLCGFTRDRKDPNLLRKIAFAPTDENNYMIELRLIKSSLSSSHAINMSSENSFKQFLACTQATTDFFKSVASGADVVIYAGHSRDGGGPDFCPPVKTKNNHVNYAWYQKHQPGITKLTDAMKIAAANGKPNQVVGLFSCSSQLHFMKKLKAVNKNAGYIVTKRIATFHEIYMDTFTTLDGLLAQRCQEGFAQSFDERGASTWRNMFKQEF